jgi:hypothetical protein
MGILNRLFGGNKVEDPISDANRNLKAKEFEIILSPVEGPITANFKGNYRSCFIDKSGRKVIEVPTPYSGLLFSDGMCHISTGGAQAKHGFINKEGKVIGDSSYYSAGFFSEGLAAVATDRGKWGFINKTGKMVIPIKFSQAGHFSDGLAGVMQGGKWGFINYKGKTRIRPNAAWKDIREFSEGLAPVRIDGKWGFINKKGKLTVATRFDKVHPFSEGLAGVMQGGKWGYIDRTGQWVIKPSFSRVSRFSESLAYVYPFKYIDTSGNTVIDFQEWKKLPNGCGRFQEGLASVSINDKWGFIDKQGTIVVPIEYESSSIYPEFSEGLADVTKDKKNCYINRRGDVVILTDADSTVGFSEGLASLSYFR